MIPAAIASGKGRSFFLWYIYGVLLWIVALIHSLVLRPDQQELDRRAVQGGSNKKCSQCAEIVKAEALICRHCGFTFPKNAASKSGEADSYLG